MVTDGATMIRFRASDLRTMGRYTQGVRLVRLKKGEQVVAIERLMDVDEDDESLASIDGEVLDDDDAAVTAAAADDAADDDTDEADDADDDTDEAGDAADDTDDADDDTDEADEE